jgi:hypothetical protein
MTASYTRKTSNTRKNSDDSITCFGVLIRRVSKSRNG